MAEHSGEAHRSRRAPDLKQAAKSYHRDELGRLSSTSGPAAASVMAAARRLEPSLVPAVCAREQHPGGTTGLPAGLMPWQGADHAKRMTGSGTTGLLARHIYRASTGKGVASAMPEEEDSASTRYRRLARECL